MNDVPPRSGVAGPAHALYVDFLLAREAHPGLTLELWLRSRAVAVDEGLARDVRELDRVRAALDRALSPTPGGGALSAAALRLAPGERVGDFVLAERLGAGAMGEVWRARQVSLARDVALKFMRHAASDGARHARFEREARAGGRLTHPGIVAVHGSGQDGDLAWIAMELVPGGRTLADRLRALRSERELPAAHYIDVARFALDLARALHAAHEHGVVHRDLKPGNVLLDPSGRPKVSDFGLAKLLDEMSLSREGEVAGTYAYMSPEQVQGKQAPIDRRTDVFSFGVLLYEMLTLGRPFDGDTADQIKLKICLHSPVDPRALRSRVPADLATIALKCLEKSPARRYVSMEAVAADLDRFLRNEPIRARAPGRWRRVELWARRNPTVTAAAGVAIVGLVALGTVLTVSAQRDRRFRELSDLRTVRALTEEADRLWPIAAERVPEYESWLARAEALAGNLSRHRAALAAVRAHARPRTEIEQRADEERHPRHEERDRLRAHLAALSVAEAARVDPSGARTAGEPDPRARSYADIVDPLRLMDIAREFVEPGREEFGLEPVGLELARRALADAPPAGRANAGVVVAWALFALGRDDEARAQIDLARRETPAPESEAVSEFLDLVERTSSPAGRARSAAEAAELREKLVEVERVVAERRTWNFADPDEGWLHEGLTAVVSEIEAFTDRERGLFEGLTPEHGLGVRTRLEHARTITRRTVEAASERWREASAAIARSPRYDGLVIRPQPGLVPLGFDPDSGLFEFVDVESGLEPERDARGAVVPGEAMGVVFVLVPGGVATIGAQNTDRNAPRYDPQSKRMTEAVRQVRLDPYFIAKYELTQAQWTRATGSNPAEQRVGREFGGKTITAAHPVETVSWESCSRVLARQGWCLPTDAQWEHAAAGGTNTKWWTGDEVESLEGAANLSDQACKRSSGQPDWWYELWLDDGWASHAPVGSYRANAFGLHDVVGNVSEWCRDGALERWRPLRDGDGESTANEPTRRSIRGGPMANFKADLCRTTYRVPVQRTLATYMIGVRPARVLQR